MAGALTPVQEHLGHRDIRIYLRLGSEDVMGEAAKIQFLFDLPGPSAGSMIDSGPSSVPPRRPDTTEDLWG